MSDTSAEYVAPQGDPHGDEVLESGPGTPPETPPEAPPETPPVAESPSEPPKPEEPPAKPKPDWKDKEMARRARRIDEERTRAETATAERERLAAENRQLQELLANAGNNPPPDQTPPVQSRQPPVDPERRYTKAEIDAEAKRIADEREFKQNFDNAYQGGAGQFGKARMDEAIARISELGGLDYDHLQMVLATDEPGRVLHELGSKPEEFQRIMELPFNRRVAEFVKMGLKTEPRAQAPSRAPATVEPISGRGGTVDNRYDDRANDADWFAAEEKRAEAAWKARKRI